MQLSKTRQVSLCTTSSMGGPTGTKPTQQTTNMKITKTLLTAIAAAVALSMTANAEGDDKKGKRDGGKGKPDKEAMEKRRADMKAKMLEKHDTNKDGKLSDDERKAAREAMGKKRKEIHAAVLAEFDKDGDKKLSEDERKGVKEWVKKNYPNARPPHRDKGGKGGKGDRKGNGGPKKGKKPAGEQGNIGHQGEDCPKKDGGCKKKKKKAE